MVQEKWIAKFAKRNGKDGRRSVMAETKDIAEMKILRDVPDIRLFWSVKKDTGEVQRKISKPASITRRIDGSLYQATGPTYNNGVGVSKIECEDNRQWHKSRGHKTRLVNLGNDKYILYTEE